MRTDSCFYIQCPTLVVSLRFFALHGRGRLVCFCFLYLFFVLRRKKKVLLSLFYSRAEWDVPGGYHRTLYYYVIFCFVSFSPRAGSTELPVHFF